MDNLERHVLTYHPEFYARTKEHLLAAKEEAGVLFPKPPQVKGHVYVPRARYSVLVKLVVEAADEVGWATNDIFRKTAVHFRRCGYEDWRTKRFISQVRSRSGMKAPRCEEKDRRPRSHQQRIIFNLLIELDEVIPVVDILWGRAHWRKKYSRKQIRSLVHSTADYYNEAIAEKRASRGTGE